MNLAEYGRIVLRRGWIMVLLAVIAAGAAFAVSQVMEPLYRSSQAVLMVPSRSDFGLTQAAVQLLNNRAAYLTSDLRAQAVIDELQLDMVPAFLLSRTTITPNRDNLTIQIDVELEADTAEEAARLINPITAAWSAQLIQYQDELNQSAQREDRVRAQIQDNPKIGLLRPNVRINVLIGAVAGFLLGAIIIFVLEYLESNVVRRPDDLVRDGFNVLASVSGAD